LDPTASSSPAPDVSAEAQAIGSALGQDPSAIEAALNAVAGSNVEQPINLGTLTLDQIAAIQQLVDAGQLPDVAIRDHPATSIAIDSDPSQEWYVAEGASILLLDVSDSGTAQSPLPPISRSR